MTSSEIRNSYLKFFKDHNHAIVQSSPVVPYDDPTLLFTNAGMNQFKDVFLGSGKRNYSRAADTQKCIRVSGKHNDLEEVGRDTYHHTFFEMLGNWSFGDYYKKEAIEWAWDLLTNVWKLPKNRLWATVYKNDDEAEQLWKLVTDIEPSHVLRFGEKDNFWEMGETGPCGPCSEIHIDRTPDGKATAAMVNTGIADVMEIWNLVFIQYNRDEKGNLTPLPSKHVDTGMGFERICAVLQEKHSNYDTDIFIPIIQKISSLTNHPYDGNLKLATDSRQFEIDTSMRVIADHIRMLTFAIGDGALPGNDGRGYVLRRILRRAARFGRTLGMHEAFIYQLVPTLVDSMSYIFPEIGTNQDHIQRVIKGEEESFNSTLDRGLDRFEEVITQIGHSKTFPGEDAFKLYDTYGFPLDLTELMASERGLKVDVGTFLQLMEQQKSRSRDSQASQSSSSSSIELKETVRQIITSSIEKKAKFVGYDRLETDSAILLAKENYLVLEATPFYAESGGQVGDTGELEIGPTTLRVTDTQKSGNVNVHILDGKITDPDVVVHARVDSVRRHSIMRNHSATHLLHNALRRVVGTHVQQAGSLVAPDYFRFDFAHFSKISDEELQEIESLVNNKIEENLPRTQGLNHIPFEEAKKLGALMFFGDKYGEYVNVIQFGDFSTEFCGGTHVASTGEIGYFKIRSEGSIASGIRRIEAVTHDYALELLKLKDKNFFERLDDAYQQLDELISLQSELHSVTDGKVGHESFGGYEQRLDDLKHFIAIPKHASIELATSFEQRTRHHQVLEEIILQLVEIKKTLDKELSRSRMKSLSNSMDDLITSAFSIESFKLVAARVHSTSIDELKAISDTLRAKLGSGVGLLASIVEGKVQLVCIVTEDLIGSRKLDAGKIVGAVAKLVGGGGGGRPQMATAGGKDITRIDEAINQTKSIVESFIRK